MSCCAYAGVVELREERPWPGLQFCYACHFSRADISSKIRITILKSLGCAVNLSLDSSVLFSLRVIVYVCHLPHLE